MIFLDAGPLIAFFNGRDNFHTQTVATLKQLAASKSQLVTTNRVIAETYDAIRYDRRVSKKKDALPTLAVFDAPAGAGKLITVEFLTEEIERQAIAILRAYPDQNFSFCDAGSFAYIEAARIRQIYTLDKRDFRTYKFKRKVTFIS